MLPFLLLHDHRPAQAITPQRQQVTLRPAAYKVLRPLNIREQDARAILSALFSA